MLLSLLFLCKAPLLPVFAQEAIGQKFSKRTGTGWEWRATALLGGGKFPCPLLCLPVMVRNHFSIESQGVG